MPAIASPGRPAAARGIAVRSTIVERRLARFHPRYRARVAALAALHTRLADLAASFPALLFALATPRFGQEPDAAIGAVIEGRPLAHIAARIGMPMWLRKLPPEAFQAPFPVLPDGEVLRRQIVNHLPRSPKRVPVWLAAVATAAECGNDPIAVWVAREVAALATAPTELNVPGLRLVVLWSWFSMNPGTAAHALIGTPWTPSMGFENAHKAAKLWRNQIDLHLRLGDRPIADMWFEPAVVDGFAFVPLATAAEIAAEGVRLENCLDTYGGLVAGNQARIWSVRRDGEPVAAIEIGRRSVRRHDSFVGVQQIRGLRNARVPAEVFAAAAQWQMAQDLTRAGTEIAPVVTEVEQRRAWISMWRPYWIVRRRIPDWLPLTPSLGYLWRA